MRMSSRFTVPFHAPSALVEKSEICGKVGKLSKGQVLRQNHRCRTGAYPLSALDDKEKGGKACGIIGVGISVRAPC